VSVYVGFRGSTQHTYLRKIRKKETKIFYFVDFVCFVVKVFLRVLCTSEVNMFISIGTLQIRSRKTFNFAAAFGNSRFAFLQEIPCLFNSDKVFRIE